METVLIAIAAFIPMLLILVVVHEFGHFLTARALGVKVLEFGFGYPPRAFGFYTGKTTVLIDQNTRFVNLESTDDLRPGQFIKVTSAEDGDGALVARIIELPSSGRAEKGLKALKELSDGDDLKHQGKVRQASSNSLVLADMLYSLNWTPLGGFVRLAGESNPAVPRGLAGRGIAPRAVVLAVGSFMNALLPIVLFTIMFMLPHDVAIGRAAVTEVVTGSPAQAAGVQPGDIILRVEGDTIESVPDLQRAFRSNSGSEMEWLIDRGGRQEIVRFTPLQNSSQGQREIGVAIELIDPQVESRWNPPWTAVHRGVNGTWDLLVMLKGEVLSMFGGGGGLEVAGPIGIAQMTGEVTQRIGLQGWLILAALFSINLAILNILPLPMLDGGRLFFVGVEWVRRGKRIRPERERVVHAIGLVVFLGIFLLVTANDIRQLFNGISFFGG